MQQSENLQKITLDQLVTAYNNNKDSYNVVLNNEAYTKLLNETIDSLQPQGVNFSAEEKEALVNVIQNIDYVNYFKLNDGNRNTKLTKESLKNAIKTGRDEEKEQYYTNLKNSTNCSKRNKTN